MDGRFNVFPHNSTPKHTHNGARITRELFASSSGSELDGGKGDEPSPRRCDAMPMRHAGATRYFAFYGVHSGISEQVIHILVFVFLVGFSFSCLDCPFVPIWDKSKKSENKHHMHLSSSSSYRKGGRGGRRPEQPVLIFGHTGKYRGIISLLLRAGFLYSNLVVVFLHLRYQTPLFFSSPADPHPRAPEAPGSLSTHLRPSLSNTQPDTPGRRGR